MSGHPRSDEDAPAPLPPVPLPPVPPPPSPVGVEVVLLVVLLVVLVVLVVPEEVPFSSSSPQATRKSPQVTAATESQVFMCIDSSRSKDGSANPPIGGPQGTRLPARKASVSATMAAGPHGCVTGATCAQTWLPHTLDFSSTFAGRRSFRRITRVIARRFAPVKRNQKPA